MLKSERGIFFPPPPLSLGRESKPGRVQLGAPGRRSEGLEQTAVLQPETKHQSVQGKHKRRTARAADSQTHNRFSLQSSDKRVCHCWDRASFASGQLDIFQRPVLCLLKKAPAGALAKNTRFCWLRTNCPPKVSKSSLGREV